MKDGGEEFINSEDLRALPPYLRYTIDSNSKKYGSLSYNARRKCWTIKASPYVTEIAKRLFPSAKGAKRGEARFTAHRRIMADLHWFLLRYPMEIKQRDKQRFENAMGEARKYALIKEINRQNKVEIIPDEKNFSGELKSFQRKGLAFLTNNQRCLLADEMGLGKTVQALAWLATTNNFPVIIVVPAHLIRNWEKEIEKFLFAKENRPKIHVIKGLTPYELPKADIYIMHYLLLRGWKEFFINSKFRAVIFDEIQELRHSGTEKYSTASIIAENCEAVIGLSGTPIYNRGGEIWNIVNILDFHFLGDWESFSREWCYGYGKGIVIKPEVLGEYLKEEGFMLRRRKANVLKELPPKRRLVHPIDEDIGIFKKLMEPVLKKLLLWKESMDESSREILAQQISMKTRQATGIAKAPYVAQFVRMLLENGERVLLFAHHHHVMDIYKKELKTFSPAFITGRENISQKERGINRFMEGKTRICCISLRAASGLNLQQATCVVFGELDWSPAVHSQAEDRAHRIGQEDSVLCYYLVSSGGSDMDMQEMLGLKVSQFVGIMGDEFPSSEYIKEQASLARQHVKMLINRMDLAV